MINSIIGILLSYLVGSIPTAYIVAKLVKDLDIRTYGSGNVGATNVFRSVGRMWGVFVLLIDMLKGLIVVIFIARFFQSDTINFRYIQILYGIAAISGHNWTIFLKFKGGKGVATTSGVVLGIFPKALLLSLLMFAVIVYITRYVSVGSMVSAVAFPLFLWLFYRKCDGFASFVLFSLVMVAFIFYRHRSNIKRLLSGSENKIVFKK